MLAESNKIAIGIIPARLYSTRFPKKILADICGKPMVICTAEAAAKSKLLSRIIIAIDDEETFHYLKNFNFETVMTSKLHQSGTDRIAEVASKLDGVDVIINIQADEPFIDHLEIDELVKSFNDSNVNISTLVSTKICTEQLKDKNIVKAILDKNGWAIDFKRTLDEFSSNYFVYKHIGIYGFTKDTLMKFVLLPQSINEKQDSLEQMRAIDNNIRIKAVITDLDMLSINTQEEYLMIKRMSR